MVVGAAAQVSEKKVNTKPAEVPKSNVKPVVTAPPKVADKPAKQPEEKKVAILPAKIVRPTPPFVAA